MPFIFENHFNEKQIKQKFQTSENYFHILNGLSIFLLFIGFFCGFVRFKGKCLFHNCHCRGQELSKSNSKSSQKQKLNLFIDDLVPDYIYLRSCFLILWHPLKMCTEQGFCVSTYSGIRHSWTPSASPLLTITLQLAGACYCLYLRIWGREKTRRVERKICIFIFK